MLSILNRTEREFLKVGNMEKGSSRLVINILCSLVAIFISTQV